MRENLQNPERNPNPPAEQSSANRADLLNGEMISQPRATAANGEVKARLRTTSRLLTQGDLDAAVGLFNRSPGWEDYAEAFRKDAERYLSNQPSAVYGVFAENGALAAVGIVIKEDWDFAYWAVTWVMVDQEMRGQGYGERVMSTLIDHAKAYQVTRPNRNCRVLLSAVDEDATRFYQKLGFAVLLSGPLPGGECLMYRDIAGPGLPRLE